MFPVTFMNRFVTKTLVYIVLLMVVQTAADVNVTTFSGSGISGFVNGNGTDAQFIHPFGLAFGQDENIYVADRDNSAIRMITPDGTVSTYTAFKRPDARISFPLAFSPAGIAFDNSGNLYISDFLNHVIWKVDTSGTVIQFAGNGTKGNLDGQGRYAYFNTPEQIAFNAGILYVADSGNNRLRSVDSNGNVLTVAGSGQNASIQGFKTTASFNIPWGVAVDKNNVIYVSELNGQYIRKVTPDGYATLYAGNGAIGKSDGISKQASFNAPSYLVLDQNNNLYVSDSENNLVRMITSNGTVTTVAGTGGGSSMDGDSGNASFNSPGGITFGPGGALYVADFLGNKIRKITFATTTSTGDLSGPSGSNMSVGMIVGIVAAVVVVVGAIGIGAFLYIRNRKPKETFVPPPPERYSINYMDAGKSINSKN